MANKQSKIEIILAAKDLNLTSVFAKGQAAHKAFISQMGTGNNTIASMRSQVVQLVGAMAGLQAIGDIGTLLQQADRNAYGLSASLQAANREFKVGSAAEWEQTIAGLSDKLKVYSQSDIKGAAAATIDMTKRLGLNAEQMRKVIELSGDLAVGRTDLAGAVERVTSALRGEAEASEYLGLTLNETYVKTWYEAKGAMQGAWKDLNDLQKAQVRYNVFVEQAIPLQGKAAASVETYDGAIKLIRKTISDSISTNEDLVTALVNVSQVLRENSSAIGSFVASMATGAASVIEFVAANQEVIVEVGKYTLIFGAAITVIGKLIATAKGLNAAFTVLVGVGIVPWLRAIETESIAATGALAGLRIGFIGLLGAAAAFFAAYKTGEWITMGKEMRELAAAQGELERATKKVNTEFRKISTATGETITSMEDLDKAVADGRIHYDELTSTWVKGARQQQQATQQTAGSMQQVTGAALEAMRKKYQDYAKEVQRIQQDIYGRERALAAELRDMGRSGMSDTSAWKDQKKEAEEYLAAAKKAAQEAQAAMNAGDTIAAGEKWKEAVQYADEAKTAYKGLNKEIKDGESVVISSNQALKTSMDGVKASGELAISLLKQQSAAQKEAMNQLSKDAGFADLTEGMDKAEKTWLKNWENMKDFAGKQILFVGEEIDAIVKDRHVKIYVERIETNQIGGLIGAYRNGGLLSSIQHLATGGGVRNILSGGRLAGYGGGDRRLLLGEDGEFMIRKEAVRRYGVNLFAALNGLRLPELPHFAAGGMVGALPGWSSGEAMTVNLAFQGGASVPVTTTREQARQLLREFERMGWRASA
mgnify:CR=1 FL=1